MFSVDGFFFSQIFCSQIGCVFSSKGLTPPLFSRRLAARKQLVLLRPRLFNFRNTRSTFKLQTAKQVARAGQKQLQLKPKTFDIWKKNREANIIMSGKNIWFFWPLTYKSYLWHIHYIDFKIRSSIAVAMECETFDNLNKVDTTNRCEALKYYIYFKYVKY